MDSQPGQSTILLIDDSASVREVLPVALKSEGYAVLEAIDGREGTKLRCELRARLVCSERTSMAQFVPA